MLAGAITNLYRGVTDEELSDILSNHLFRTIESTSSTKLFWLNQDSAEGFAQAFSDVTHVVRAQVPSDVIDQATYATSSLDNLGPAVGFSGSALDTLNYLLISIGVIF
jgi:hypothetical protein